MVVTTGVFMVELGKETEEAVLVVGQLIGENFQNQVIGMCSDGWTGVLPRLSAPFHTCLEATLMIKATQSYAHFSAPTLKSRDTLTQHLHNIPLSSLATKSTVLVHTPHRRIDCLCVLSVTPPEQRQSTKSLQSHSFEHCTSCC